MNILNRAKIRIGLHQKLFMAVLLIMAGNILLMLLLGSVSFEKLYMSNKINELKSGARQIKDAFVVGDAEYIEALGSVEKMNTIIHIFHMNDSGEVVVDYFSRMGFSPATDKSPFESDRFVKDRLGEFLTGYVNENPNFEDREDSIVTYSNEHKPPKNSISLYTRLSNESYMLLETPRQYIAESAELAIRACAGISLITLLLASAALYFACKKMTSPITQIQRTAEGIANLDFSVRCSVVSTDELGMLAQDINEMADSLQKNILELEEMNQMLRDDLHRSEQQYQMRKRFIANVSHDFKTPLTLITSYADSLMNLPQGQQELREEYCRIISDQGYKMTGQVQALLQLSRLESGMATLCLMDFSLNELIKEAIKKYRPLMQERGITLELNLPDETIVSADYQKIEQVFTNLFENAVKYATLEKHVKVSSKIVEEHCRVSVINSSSPIPNDMLDRFFISFYRTDDAREQKDNGYGLGLAIVKSVMELHHGEYGVRNTPDGIEAWFNLELSTINDNGTADEN